MQNSILEKIKGATESYIKDHDMVYTALYLLREDDRRLFQFV